MTATSLRNLNNSRLERSLFSDSNPVLKALIPVAELVRANRKPVSPDNPWLIAEQKNSAAIRQAWDTYRDKRDSGYEKLFKSIYESPLLADLAGFKPETKKARSHGLDKKIRERQAEHDQWFEHGSVETGFMRLLIFVASGNGVIDERPFNGIKRVMLELGLNKTINLQQLKDTIKQQTYLVRMDGQRALNGLTKLLPAKEERQRAINLARELLALSGPISPEKESRLQVVEQVLKTNSLALKPAPKLIRASKKVIAPVIQKVKPTPRKRLKSTKS